MAGRVWVSWESHLDASLSELDGASQARQTSAHDDDPIFRTSIGAPALRKEGQSWPCNATVPSHTRQAGREVDIQGVRHRSCSRDPPHP